MADALTGMLMDLLLYLPDNSAICVDAADPIRQFCRTPALEQLRRKKAAHSREKRHQGALLGVADRSGTADARSR